MFDGVKRVTRWADENPDRAVVGGIVVASFARLAYVAYLGDDLGGPDSNTYDQAAWDLREHGLLSDRVAGLPFWAPGYPMLLAAHYAIVGRHPFAIKLTQVAMIALLSWLTYAVAKQVAKPPAPLLTGLGMSASLAWLALPHPLMYEPWLALLLVALVWLLLTREASLARVAVAGVVLGVASAFQNKTITLVPFVALWLYWFDSRPRPRKWAGIGVLTLASALVIAAFVLRNVVVYDEPILIATKNGANFLYGTNRDADGSIANQPTQNLEWCPGVDVFDTSDYVGTDRQLFACGIRELAADPLHQLRILPNKFARFWATYVGPWSELNNWRHHFDFRSGLPDGVVGSSWFRNLDRAASSMWVIATLVLMVVGTAALRNEGGSRATALVLLPVAWLLATHLATFGDPRFRIPVLPLAWVLQAAGAVAVARRVARGAQ